MQEESLPGVPEGWPFRTLAEVEAELCAPGARFEIETIEIGGIEIPVWKNALADLTKLVELGRSHGDSLFIGYQDERISYDAWYRAVAALAHHLQSIGIGKGDRVALAMRNLPEWPVVFFAVVSIGAVCVPLNAWWTGQELAYGLNHSGAKLLICDHERCERVLEQLARVDALEGIVCCRSETDRKDVTHLEAIIGPPSAWGTLPDRDLPEVAIASDDQATILYTSGTTGKPKGAVGTHRNFLTNILTSAYAAARAALRRGEPVPEPQRKVLLMVIPLFHVTACSATMMGAIAAGNAIHLMYKWDPLKALGIIERERVNVTGGVPTIAWQLLEHPDREKFDISSLETISYGGAPSAPDLVRKIREVLDAIPSNGWGMTETTSTVTTNAAEDYLNRPTSAGPAVPVARLKTVAPDGHATPPGEVGELLAFGPMMVRQYWNDPAANAATFENGWVRTGDLAVLDEEGFCYIVDRAKDIVIRGGENIYSTEVENVLFEHPAVIDAAVVGIPHRTLGEEPAAVVQLGPGLNVSEGELQDFVRTRLAAFKVPVKIHFMTEPLPRNPNGKVLKKELRSLVSS